MNVMTKRGISLLMTLCMVLSLVVLPSAKAAVADILSTPTYANTLDTVEDLNEDNAESTRPGNVSGHSENLPLGWTFKNNNSRNSSLKEAGGRTYWQMKTSANRNSATFAYYQFQSENNKDLVLSYDFMTDCEDEAYVIQLPIPAAGNTSRTMDLRIENDILCFDGTGYSKTLTKGEWYHIDIACTSANVVKIYIDNALEYTKTNHYGLRNATTLYYLNMSLGSGAHAASVTMNLDNLAVYSYVAGTEFAAAQASYEVKAGETVVTAWTKTADAYLASVTFESSDKTVATVDENGVVTGVSGGTVTITATPNAASGLPAATTQVTVKDSNVAEAVYYNSMDALETADEASNVTWGVYMPDGWSYPSGSQAASTSVIKTEADRTYYFMTTTADKDAVAWSARQDAANLNGSNIMTYSFKVDNDNISDTWTVYLPAFGTGDKAHTVALQVTDNVLNFGTEAAMSIQSGTWYDVELLLDNGKVVVFIDGNHFVTSAVDAEGLSYLVMGLDGKTATETAGLNMSIDELSVYNLEDVVVAVNGTYYKNVDAAVTAAIDSDAALTLYKDVDTVTVPAGKTLNLDLNGHNVATLNAEGTVYGSDSSTKVYTNETYGKITAVTGEGLANIHYTDGATAKTGYVTDSADGYSFHHFEVKIASVTLRAEASGIGYKLYMAGNARVKTLLNAEDAYGVTVYISGYEANGNSAHAGADTFAVGTKMVMIKNIFTGGTDDATKGEMKVCVNGYIQFGQTKVEVSYTAGKSLKELVEAANTVFESYDEEQQAGLVSFYNTYISGKDAFSGWSLSKIAAAVAPQN